MKDLLAVALLPALALALMAGAAPGPAGAAEPQLSHVVIFTLKDHSKSSREAFLASCQKYLTGHEGVASFAVGTIAEDVVEPPSDREFDVTLHLVFASKAASDAYQKGPRHRQFVAENKASFAKVRVFDSYLAPASR